MRRNTVIMMIVTFGALCVFNTSGYCGSDVGSSGRGSIGSDPHDGGFDITASVRQHTVETSYTSGDPHKTLDVEVTRQPNVDGTPYISGDPHDTEDADIVLPVIRRSFVLNSLISDPHEERRD